MHGLRVVVVGASSGIGRQVAISAAAGGARVAVAARRLELLEPLAAQIGGSAHQLDVADPEACSTVLAKIAAELGGIDVLVVASATMPVGRIETVSAESWQRAFAVNVIGPSLLIAGALPHLAPGAVVAVTSSDGVGRPRAGLAPYSASKAALDEALISWRLEHPGLTLVRVVVGPTIGTDILDGAEPALLDALIGEWAAAAQLPTELSATEDVATAILDVVLAARRSPSVFSDVVRLTPRAVPVVPGRESP